VLVNAPDDEIRDAVELLAGTEGIFAETGGGVTVGVAKKLIASGKIPRDSSAVICITGNGLKTLDAVNGYCGNRNQRRHHRQGDCRIPFVIRRIAATFQI
jgi:threonine synthase